MSKPPPTKDPSAIDPSTASVDDLKAAFNYLQGMVNRSGGIRDWLGTLAGIIGGLTGVGALAVAIYSAQSTHNDSQQAIDTSRQANDQARTANEQARKALQPKLVVAPYVACSPDFSSSTDQDYLNRSNYHVHLLYTVYQQAEERAYQQAKAQALTPCSAASYLFELVINTGTGAAVSPTLYPEAPSLVNGQAAPDGYLTWAPNIPVTGYKYLNLPSGEMIALLIDELKSSNMASSRFKRFVLGVQYQDIFGDPPQDVRMPLDTSNIEAIPTATPTSPTPPTATSTPSTPVHQAPQVFATPPIYATPWQISVSPDQIPALRLLPHVVPYVLEVQ